MSTPLLDSTYATAADLVPGTPPLQHGLLGKFNAEQVGREVRKRGYHGGEPLGASMCAKCHPDVTAQWAQSAHRFASFNNPYYTTVANAFRRQHGDGHFRFCANCHDPALTPRAEPVPTNQQDPEGQAGITCLLCHSISTPPGLIGNGQYQADLARFPMGSGHAARLRSPTLMTTQLCGACHKVSLPESVTNSRWLRGQNEYDGWRDSVWDGRGVSTVLKPKSRRTCQGCHMPRVRAALGDRAAKNGRVADHRFLGANTALAHLRGDQNMVDATHEFLRRKIHLNLAQSRQGIIDIVMLNQGVGHPFPGGVNDTNEAWLQWVFIGADGQVLDTGGQLDPEGNLSDDAYRIRAQPVTASGDPISQRAIEQARGIAFDTRLFPLTPRSVRLVVPKDAHQVSVAILYRQHDAAFAAFACAPLPNGPDKVRCHTPPITMVNSVKARLTLTGRLKLSFDWREQLIHGLALTGGFTHHALEAIPILERLQKLKPNRIEPLLGLAMAAAKLGRTDHVIALGRQIDAIEKDSTTRYWIEAAALTQAFRHKKAWIAMEKLLLLVPDDRHALALAARLQGLNAEPRAALKTAKRLIKIDPENAHAWLQVALAKRDLGLPNTAAHQYWLRYRVDKANQSQLRGKLRRKRPRLMARTDPIAVLNDPIF